MVRTIKIDDARFGVVEFTVRKGKGDCELEVANGDDIGMVSYRPEAPWQCYMGHFPIKSGGSYPRDSIDAAVHDVARQILKVRNALSEKEACEAMEKYLAG